MIPAARWTRLGGLAVAKLAGNAVRAFGRTARARWRELALTCRTVADLGAELGVVLHGSLTCGARCTGSVRLRVRQARDERARCAREPLRAGLGVLAVAEGAALTRPAATVGSGTSGTPYVLAGGAFPSRPTGRGRIVVVIPAVVLLTTGVLYRAPVAILACCASGTAGVDGGHAPLTVDAHAAGWARCRDLFEGGIVLESPEHGGVVRGEARRGECGGCQGRDQHTKATDSRSHPGGLPRSGGPINLCARSAKLAARAAGQIETARDPRRV